MTRHPALLSAVLLALLLLLSGAGPTESKRLEARLVVIVAAQSPLQDISRPLLRRVFTGNPAELGGTRLVPLNYGPDDPLRTAFDRLVLGFSQEAAGRYWVDRRIRGQGLPPRAIPNVALLRAVVAKLPGAIGYVTADKLDATVKPLRIDGHDYTSAEYPLKLVP